MNTTIHHFSKVLTKKRKKNGRARMKGEKRKRKECNRKKKRYREYDHKKIVKFVSYK